MARKLQPREPDVFAIVGTVNELVDGRSNNVGSVGDNTSIKLTPGATTTTVNFATVSVGSCILLSPRTANAAAAVPTTYISNVFNGSFIITHANNAQVDRTFDFCAVGG
jgi:hypothetical protein